MLPDIADLAPEDRPKFAAARHACGLVKSGMTIGLGTGSTAAWLVRCLGAMVRGEGLQIRGVPTSTRTAALAREEGITVITLEEAGWLDLTIDGADEFDADLTLIKGGGGALLHEKIVATASDRMVVIADPGKEVARLGAFPLPVEVIPFGWQATRTLIEEALVGLDMAGRDITLRQAGDAPFRTDEGNLILDLHLGRIANARRLADDLIRIAGVVETGLFIDICDTVVIGHADGRAETRDLLGKGERGFDPAGEDNIFTEVPD